MVNLRRRRARVTGAVLLAVVATLAIAAPAPAVTRTLTFPIDEPFRGPTTNNPNWVFTNDPADGVPTLPVLTNEGTGWLRLTNADNFRAGSAVIDDNFPTNLGIVVQFDYVTWGGVALGANRGDGFSFFLLDGSFPASVGISGGGLGYTQLQGGYIGVGFDEFGNFSGSLGGPGQRPNNIAVRGAYNNTNGGWWWLAGTPAPGGTVETGTTTRGLPRTVRLTITPASGGELMSVMSNTGPGTPLVPVFTDFNLRAAGQPAVPPTFKIGFSGSTGGATNFHEIRDLTINVPTDLEVSKTATAVVNPRHDVTYTLTAANRYFNPVSNAVVHDVVPAGITNVTWTCAPGALGGTCVTPSGSGNTIDARVNLPVEDSTAVVTVHGTASDATAGTTVTNSATVVPPADRLDLDGTNNVATAVTQVLPFADLAVTKTSGTAAVQFGDPISYQLGITNNGPGTAVGAAIVDPIPAAIDPASVQAPGCTVAAAVLTCPVGTLAPGESQQFAVTGTVSGSEVACASGTIVNTANATATVSADNVPDNDVASVSTPCTVPVNVSVTKTAPATVTLGDRFSYRITVTNNGPYGAPNTAIDDQVPSEIDDVSWGCTVSDGSACAPPSGSGNTVHTTASIPHGGTATVTVTGTAAVIGDTGNTAIIAPCPHCTDLGGAHESASVTVRVLKPILPVTNVSFRRIADVGGIALIIGLVLLFAGQRRTIV